MVQAVVFCVRYIERGGGGVGGGRVRLTGKIVRGYGTPVDTNVETPVDIYVDKSKL